MKLNCTGHKMTSCTPCSHTMTNRYDETRQGCRLSCDVCSDERRTRNENERLATAAVAAAQTLVTRTATRRTRLGYCIDCERPVYEKRGYRNQEILCPRCDS